MLHFADTNHHGTRCAGEIAGAANGVCGRGVAYDAKISGQLLPLMYDATVEPSLTPRLKYS